METKRASYRTLNRCYPETGGYHRLFDSYEEYHEFDKEPKIIHVDGTLTTCLFCKDTDIKNIHNHLMKKHNYRTFKGGYVAVTEMNWKLMKTLENEVVFDQLANYFGVVKKTVSFITCFHPSSEVTKKAAFFGDSHWNRYVVDRMMWFGGEEKISVLSSCKSLLTSNKLMCSYLQHVSLVDECFSQALNDHSVATVFEALFYYLIVHDKHLVNTFVTKVLLHLYDLESRGITAGGRKLTEDGVVAFYDRIHHDVTTEGGYEWKHSDISTCQAMIDSFQGMIFEIPEPDSLLCPDSVRFVSKIGWNPNQLVSMH
jgi:hypothetical protein